MGIKTAIIAGLFSLVLPVFVPVAFATSNSGSGITESWQENGNSGVNSSVTDAETARRELFSQPFYQPETQPLAIGNGYYPKALKAPKSRGYNNA